MKHLFSGMPIVALAKAEYIPLNQSEKNSVLASKLHLLINSSVPFLLKNERDD